MSGLGQLMNVAHFLALPGKWLSSLLSCLVFDYCCSGVRPLLAASTQCIVGAQSTFVESSVAQTEFAEIKELAQIQN